MRAGNPRPNRLFLLTIEFARPSLKPQAPDSPSEQARGQPSTAAIGFASLRPVWQALVERGGRERARPAARARSIPMTALADPFRIIAHRGASGYAPENTMAAFQRAVDMGATEVETDVCFARDGRLVLLHDDTLDRT